MAAYIALGAAGCTTASGTTVTWSNMSFSGTLNGQAIDPERINVNFVAVPFTPHSYTENFYGSILDLPNATSFDLNIQFGYAVAVTGLPKIRVAYGSATYFSNDNFYSNTISNALDVCEGGEYAPQCTGTEYLNYTDPIIPFYLHGDQTLASANVRSQITTSNSIYLLRFEGGALIETSPVPEPSTTVFLLPALAFLWLGRIAQNSSKP